MRVKLGRAYLGLRRVTFLLVAIVAVFTSLISVPSAYAAGDDGFSLQVSPSPLTATIQPGKNTTLELRIRNTSSASQDLKMGLRSFTIAPSDGKIQLGSNAPAEVAQFVSFSNPTFSLQAGAIFTQQISIDTPTSAGFTYSFAITISQQHPQKADKGTTAIQGSVAVFTLLSVDRPGAIRKLSLEKLTVSKHVYDYLPAKISVAIKNSGNTLAQPRGSIFIQRHSNDTQPIAAIPLNSNNGYILPNSSRTLTPSWSDGFPHYISVSDNGKPAQKLSWQGGDISKLRFGHYIAKVVAVYDDGGRDVPLNAEVSFWVIPWQPIAIVLLVVALLLVGLITIFRKSSKAIRRTTAKKVHEKPKA